jgi:hypothetical protein
MSDSDIATAIQNNYPQIHPQSVGGFLAREAARIPLKAALAIGGMPADLGVFARNQLGNAYNYLTGNPKTPDYTLPSQDANRYLDSLIRPPDGTAANIMENLDSGLLAGKMPNPAAAGSVPSNFVRPADSLRQAVVQRAQQQGYVVPPASANPTAGNRLLTMIAGRQRLMEATQGANRPVTNSVMARSLGQRPDAQLTPGALQVIRNDAYQNGYAPIDQFGQLTSDATFRATISNLLRTTQKAEQAFPGITRGSSSQVADTLGTLEKPLAFNSDGARAAVQHLRDVADTAFANGNAADGNTYKSAAKAVEDLIERNLASRTGDSAQQALANFRSARARISQSYTVQKALQGPDVDAAKIGAAVAAAPAKFAGTSTQTVGDFYNTFKNAAKLPTGIPGMGNNLDMYAATTAALAGHSWLPFGIPIPRALAAKYLLSPQGQARALQTAYSSPEQLGGLLGMVGQGSTAQ